MDLRSKLPLLCYWNLDSIIEVIFEDKDPDEGEVSNEKDLVEKIETAIETGALKGKVSPNKGNSRYFQKNEFSEWFYKSFGYTFSTYLNEPSLAFLTSSEPDYTLFASATYENGKFSSRDAFCYLAKIPITRSENNWSQEQTEDYHQFETFIDGDEKLSPQDIISIAERAGLPVPEEMQIPITHFNDFFTARSNIDPELQEAIDELHQKNPRLSHTQLCNKLVDTKKGKYKSAERIRKLTRSPR